MTPQFAHSPSRLQWGVIIHGGTDLRTGHPLQPLEFQYSAALYDARQIRRVAADKASAQRRTGFIVRAPIGGGK